MKENLMSDNIKLMEVFSTSHGAAKTYSLREIYINPGQVVCLRSEDVFERLLHEGRLVDGLDKRQKFTRISVNTNLHQEDIVVIGTLDEVYKKLNFETNRLLRG